MRYVVYGAGAIGGAMAGRLAQAGSDVAVIARGTHLAAIRDSGLQLVTGQGVTTVRLAAFDGPEDAQIGNGDVVILAVKSQDTEAALTRLDAVTSSADVAVACAQNGVANESAVARRGFPTYGMCVTVPATHLEPGVVELPMTPVAGVVDVGRFPSGSDDVAKMVALDLAAAGFAAQARADIMRWKYAKLLGNVESAVDAAAGPAGRGSDVGARARAEALACLTAAGIDYASDGEVAESKAALKDSTVVSPTQGAGGSSWQSLRRGSARIEADWLNGEIVLLGALCGVATPVNDGLRGLANRMARDGLQPGSLSLADVEQAVAVPS